MPNNLAPVSMVWALILFLIMHTLLVTADGNPIGDKGPPIYCKSELYGTPVIDDCKEAMKWIPYVSLPRGRWDRNEATTFRLFAEPQYLKPPWKALANPFAPLAIEQLPKIWKHSM